MILAHKFFKKKKTLKSKKYKKKIKKNDQKNELSVIAD